MLLNFKNFIFEKFLKFDYQKFIDIDISASGLNNNHICQPKKNTAFAVYHFYENRINVYTIEILKLLSNFWLLLEISPLFRSLQFSTERLVCNNWYAFLSLAFLVVSRYELHSWSSITWSMYCYRGLPLRFLPSETRPSNSMCLRIWSIHSFCLFVIVFHNDHITLSKSSSLVTPYSFAFFCSTTFRTPTIVGGK